MYNQDYLTNEITNETNDTTLSNNENINENRNNQYALIQKINNDIYENNFYSDNDFKKSFETISSDDDIYTINNEKKINLNITEFKNNNDN